MLLWCQFHRIRIFKEIHNWHEGIKSSFQEVTNEVFFFLKRYIQNHDVPGHPCFFVLCWQSNNLEERFCLRQYLLSISCKGYGIQLTIQFLDGSRKRIVIRIMRRWQIPPRSQLIVDQRNLLSPFSLENFFHFIFAAKGTGSPSLLCHGLEWKIVTTFRV